MSYKYLLDANVLSNKGVKDIINTAFFAENCIVIEEIAYELTETSIGARLRDIATSPDIHILIHLRDIVDDLVKAGILKTDLGNGDAVLIASALSMKSETGDQTSLFSMRDKPIVVTNERLVDIYAKSKGVDVINSKEFLDIAESSRHFSKASSLI